MVSRFDELEEMKRIDLCQFATSLGFVLDLRQSSRASAVMKHSNGDKIVISRLASGQYIYFNAKGDDNGTIIDLIQTRDRVSLGEVRKQLRPWLNSTVRGTSASQTLRFPLQPSNRAQARVLQAWMKAKAIGSDTTYLAKDRGIPSRVLHHEKFRDRIRIDDRRNSVFPHFNNSGLCGFELKNRRFTGFSAGGVKGLASSRADEGDDCMVICETAIDMLSYAALKGVDGRRFFSTAGQISPLQADCLRSAAEKMPSQGRVILALDHDEGGHRLAAQIRDALSNSRHTLIEDFPPNPGQDWNDVLRMPTDRRTKSFSPTVS